MESSAKEVKTEVVHFYRVYKDGTVERLQGTPYVPPRLDDPVTGVSSKDISISQNPLIQARIHLPKLNPNSAQKLPVLVYFHGGAFCVESAFSLVEHQFMTSLAAEAQCLAISIEYRLAPEHPLPAAYEDCWYALRWVGSHLLAPEAREPGFELDPWVSDHADFDRIFLGGDSAGANLAHNTIMRAATEELPCRVKIHGALITHPFFMGSKVSGQENSYELSMLKELYPSAEDVTNDPRINPIFAAKAPSLATMPCKRLLVVISKEDFMVDRGRLYYGAMKESGWKGELELIEVEGEGHGFHIVSYEKDSAKALIKRLATYLSN